LKMNLDEINKGDCKYFSAIVSDFQDMKHFYFWSDVVNTLQITRRRSFKEAFEKSADPVAEVKKLS